MQSLTSQYNLNGQLVEVILNDFVYPGNYSLEWDAKFLQVLFNSGYL